MNIRVMKMGLIVGTVIGSTFAFSPLASASAPHNTDHLAGYVFNNNAGILVARAERPERTERPEKLERPEKPEGAEKPEGVEKPEGAEKVGILNLNSVQMAHAERPEGREKPEKPEGKEKVG